MKKFAKGAQMIQERISLANDALVGIPSERQLAEELKLSRNTLRKAVQQLIDEGILARQENGRLEVVKSFNRTSKKTIGFITPVGTSHNRDKWRACLDGVIRSLSNNSAVLHSVTYSNWSDDVFQDSLTNFDGAFLMTPSERMPTRLINKINASRCRIISLDHDYSADNIPSVMMFSYAAQIKLLDYLYRLGHRRIDCINTQAIGQAIEGRIAVWRDYIDTHQLTGEFFSLEENKPADSAYKLVRGALNEGRLLASAIICTTGPCAIGTMRALHEAGLKIGEDVSVCAINSEGLGRLLLRSLTALEPPPRALFMRPVCEWMISDQEWQGPKLIQPDDLPFYEGESTGPVSVNSILSRSTHWVNSSIPNSITTGS